MKKLFLCLLIALCASAFAGGTGTTPPVPQPPGAAAITGGTIDGTTIGGTTPAAVTGTNVTATTQFIGAVGSVSAPSFTFSGELGTGFYKAGASDIRASLSGADAFRINNSNIVIDAAHGLAWGSTGVTGTDLLLFRDGMGLFAQRNGTNAQAYRLYNTYTDASNYERLTVSWASNIATIANEAAGTGTLRTFKLGASGKGNVSQLYMDYTNTGTVGNVTINKAAGRVNLAAAGTSLTVTDSLITAASHCFLNADGAPGNVVAVQLYAVPAAGSFTVNAVPAVTNQTAIDFFCVNAD